MPAVPNWKPLSKRSRTTIAEKLTENEVPFVEIQGRVKRLYSLWKKLKKQKIMIEQVYDLIAARIITAERQKELLPRAERHPRHLDARSRAF